ncbi:insulinase family protein [Catenovulum maritimum]|uniref:Protease 3 n=1 Tax=Catenovulum maritimum TaxID=1513271 RepID=A0A0J8JKU5_9ALTE|nr:insulinase family protein [Catenovulum maritimum]KMT65136.1 hypothetical protein XM47_10380 [Catenovulum maritimum]
MIKTSPLDEQAYHHYKLDNGLNVILIESPACSKSAVSMSIAAGNYNDPDDCLGIAHFLEHMLFLGTEKFHSKEDDFAQFVEKRAGHTNAWTSLEQTNFYFDIHNNFITEAVERFSQFFICPLFDPKAIETEQVNINSEYELKLKDEIRRLHDVHKQAVNPKHPYSRFTVGSKDTLVEKDGISLKQRLHQYFDENYTADKMNLCILSHLPLRHQKQLVDAFFSGIKAESETATTSLPLLYRRQDLGIKIQVQTLRDIKRVIFNFPLPSEAKDYKAKSLSYLSAIFGHESEGSLLSQLKQLGLATSLTAGGGVDNHITQDFNISIQLTQMTDDNINNVANVLFNFIEYLKQQSYLDHIYQDKKQLASFAFNDLEMHKPIDWVSQISLKMQHYAIEDVICGDYIMSDMNQDWLKQAFKALVPENLRLSILSNAKINNAISPWYHTPYSISEISKQEKHLWLTSKYHLAFKNLQPNPYIPKQQFQNKLEKNKSLEKPSILYKTENTKIWYEKNTQFPQAYGHIYVSLDLESCFTDMANQACMLRLFIEMFMESVQADNYPAEAAGLHYQISAHQAGLTIHISGYAEKQSEFCNKLLLQLLNSQFSFEQFELAKTKLLTSWNNTSHSKPVQQLFSMLTNLVQNNQYSYPSLYNALSEITLAEFEYFKQQLFASINIESFIIGCWQADQAMLIGKNIVSIFANSKPCHEFNRYVYLLPKLPQHVHLSIETSDIAVVNYFQSNKSSDKDKAYYMLLNQLLSPIVFQVLRGQKQLGYMLGSAYMPVNNTAGLIVYVQSSTHTDLDIQTNIEELLFHFSEILEQLSAEEWQQMKQGLINQLEDKSLSLRALAQNRWTSIGLKDTRFNRHATVVAELELIELEQMQVFSKQLFRDNSAGSQLLMTASPKENIKFMENYQNCGLDNLIELISNNKLN